DGKTADGKSVGDKDAGGKDTGKKDQAYWAGRMKSAQEAVDRDSTLADAMQSRINALTADFVNRDDPAQRTAIERDRQRAVTELRLTDGDGFGVLRAAKEIDPQMPVIVMTAFGSIQDAVAAMKEGAMDFLAKPVDPEHLLLLVERALMQRRLTTENILLKEE